MGSLGFLGVHLFAEMPAELFLKGGCGQFIFLEGVFVVVIKVEGRGDAVGGGLECHAGDPVTFEVGADAFEELASVFGPHEVTDVWHGRFSFLG